MAALASLSAVIDMVFTGPFFEWCMSNGAEFWEHTASMTVRERWIETHSPPKKIFSLRLLTTARSFALAITPVKLTTMHVQLVLF